MQTPHIFKALMTAAFITGSVGIVSPAYAADAEREKVIANIDVQDLATERGIEDVYTKLSRTAKSSCKVASRQPSSFPTSVKRCTRRLLRSYIRDIDHDGLTAYHKAAS
jgi:UrcA family protein